MRAMYIIWLRHVKKFARSKVSILGSLGMPFFFLASIGFGLNAIVTIPDTDISYLAFIAPGIIAMGILFISMFGGMQVVWDKRFGFLKNTLVAPVSRTQIMLGMTIGGATTSTLQGFLILLIALALGVTIISVVGLLIAIAFMLLIGVAFTALGLAIASRMENLQSFPYVVNFVIFPIFFLSNALFPLDTLPVWFQYISFIDPLTYGVDGIRFGLLGLSSIPVGVSFGVLFAFTAAMVLIGARQFRKIRL